VWPIHIGLLAGWVGLVLAGVCFILPAAILVTLIAWAYSEFGTLPQVAGVLYGIKPVIIAVVAQALWRLGRGTLKTWSRVGLAAAAMGLAAAGVHELVLLCIAGATMALGRWFMGPKRTPPAVLAVGPIPWAGAMLLAAPAVAVPFTLGGLFLFFLKVGSILYGSGYVLLAFLRADLVERFGWLTETQLLDAIAVGQFTPGPIFTTATFVGYVLAGVPGAIIATVGIFLRAFFFVAMSGLLLPWMRSSPIVGAFLDGVVIASLALMAVVTWGLARTALVDGLTGVLAVASAALLWRFKPNSAWLIIAGGMVGWLASL